MAEASISHCNRAYALGYAVQNCGCPAGRHPPHLVEHYPLPTGGYGEKVCLGGNPILRKEYEGGKNKDLYVRYVVEVV